MPAKPPQRPRTGRRSGATSTRGAVLEAARARFARDGYTATSIRKIAADAGVDASQVVQFFGKKDELFATIMSVPVSALRRFDEAFEGPPHLRGERIVRAFLGSWEGDVAESEPLMAMLRGAINNDQAAAQLRDFLHSRLQRSTDQGCAKEWPLRSGLAAAMLVGVLTTRRIIGVPEVAAADHEKLVALLAPAIQAVLDK